MSTFWIRTWVVRDVRKPWRDNCLGMLLHLLTGKKEASHPEIACMNVHVLGYKSANVISVRYATSARATMQCFDRLLQIFLTLAIRQRRLVY